MPEPESIDRVPATAKSVQTSTISLMEKELTAIAAALKNIRKIKSKVPPDVHAGVLRDVTTKLESLTGLKEAIRQEAEEARHRDHIEFLRLEAALREGARQKEWR